MRRRITLAAASLLLVAAATAVSAGCSARGGDLDLSGRVADETVVVAMPVLPTVTPRIAASATLSPAASAGRSRQTTAATLARIGSVTRIATVAVEAGDRVRAGDVVAVLDDAALAAAVEAARASQRVADAQVGVLGARLDDVADARATIAGRRADVRSAIAQLTATRADLIAQRAAAATQLAALEALRARLSQLPPGVAPPTGTIPTGTPTGAAIDAAIAQLRAGIAKMDAGLAKIDAGLAQARTGLAKLADASATAADARGTLEGVREVARDAARATGVGVELASVRRDLAVLRAPADGIVVQAARAGDALPAGAPVVVIRPDATAAIDVFIAPKALGDLAPGDAAQVRTDSSGDAAYSATVSWIGPRAVYPPSWMATTDVHLTRARPVRVTLDDAAVHLAPGTPADVTISGTGD